MKKILLVTPSIAKARSSNTGNGQTAKRWGDYLSQRYHVETHLSFYTDRFDAMLALHAFRSAGAIRQFSASGKPVALVLTGTDIYGDIHKEPSAFESLELADLLVTLQPEAIKELPERLRYKARTIFQSCPAFEAIEPRKTSFDVVFVGHLRAVKDPLTVARAVLQSGLRKLQLRFIGTVLEEPIGHEIVQLTQRDARLQYLGGLTHSQTLKEIRRARLLVCSSIMEGGAHAILESIRCQTPVLASRISGNIGMLGEDYLGYFPVGDSQALARLIERCHADPEFYAQLHAQCQARFDLFDPQREQSAVLQLASDLLSKAPG